MIYIFLNQIIIMKKESLLQEATKIEKQNIIVFKKRNSGRLKPNFREQEDTQHKINIPNKPKSQISSQQSVKFPRNQIKLQKKALPLLGLAGNNTGKKIIIQKALLQYSKNLPPTSLYHDKEALLQQSLQLKQKNNQLINENVKLKTKLMAIQKQNAKLQRGYEEQSQAKRPTVKQIKTKSNQQILNSLKNLLKESKKQSEQLLEQNNRIKKSIKYTRINQLQQQKKSYYQETIRLRQLLQKQLSQNINNKLNQHDISSLQHKLLSQIEANNHLKKQNNELNQKNKNLEQKMKGFSKNTENEKNLNKIIMNLKKSLKDKESEIQNIRRIQRQQISTANTVKQQKIKVSSAKKSRTQKQIKITPCDKCTKLKEELQSFRQKIKSFENQIKQKNILIETYSKEKASHFSKTMVKKPTLEYIKHVAQFLIYRFKAHHLTLQTVQTYLFKKDSKMTSISEMIEILLIQPFFITNSDYLEALVIYLFYNDKNQSEFEIEEKFQKSNQQILAIFKSLIGQYVIMDQKKQEEMFIQIAELVTNYCKHISAAFDAKRNGEGTLDRTQLYTFLNQIQLQKEYIEFIIIQIILQSFDLQHLNYYALFQIFYLPNQEQQPNYMIDKQIVNHKLPLENQIKQQDEQYEQSHSQFQKSKSVETEQKIGKSINNKKQSEWKNQQNKIDEQKYDEDFCDQEQEKIEQTKNVQQNEHEIDKSRQEDDEKYSQDYES